MPDQCCNKETCDYLHAAYELCAKYEHLSTRSDLASAPVAQQRCGHIILFFMLPIGEHMCFVNIKAKYKK